MNQLHHLSKQFAKQNKKKRKENNNNNNKETKPQQQPKIQNNNNNNSSSNNNIQTDRQTSPPPSFYLSFLSFLLTSHVPWASSLLLWFALSADIKYRPFGGTQNFLGLLSAADEPVTHPTLGVGSFAYPKCGVCDRFIRCGKKAKEILCPPKRPIFDVSGKCKPQEKATCPGYV